MPNLSNYSPTRWITRNMKPYSITNLHGGPGVVSGAPDPEKSSLVNFPNIHFPYYYYYFWRILFVALLCSALLFLRALRQQNFPPSPKDNFGLWWSRSVYLSTKGQKSKKESRRETWTGRQSKPSCLWDRFKLTNYVWASKQAQQKVFNLANIDT